MENPEDIDFPATPAWWGNDRLYAALRLPETPPLASCPQCRETVWAPATGKLLDNLAYRIEHRCNDPRAIIPRPTLPLPQPEQEQQATGGTLLSELEALIGKPPEAGKET